MNRSLAGLLSLTLFSGHLFAAEAVRVVPRGETEEKRSRSVESSGSINAPVSRSSRVTVERSSKPRERSLGAYHREVTVRRDDRVPRQFSVGRDQSFDSRVRSHTSTRIVPGRPSWYSYRGHRYAHYYHRNRHWYGFYDGPRFYWTQYYRNRWWWYDPIQTHWSFWWHGYWWYGAPGGAYYVYLNDSYVPYEIAGIDAPRPEEYIEDVDDVPEGLPPVDSEGSSPLKDSSFKSPDGSRMVQIAGDAGEAFLYDTSGSQPVFLKVLGKKVTQARYSGGTNGQPLEILLDFEDGHYERFRASGDLQR